MMARQMSRNEVAVRVSLLVGQNTIADTVLPATIYIPSDGQFTTSCTGDRVIALKRQISL